MNRQPLFPWIAIAVLAVGGCGGESTAPEPTPPAEDIHHYTRADVHPEGQVVETAQGFTVTGALHLDNEAGPTSFHDAALEVQFDEQGRLRSVSGRATIPPPSDRVSFANPIQADVGFFSGEFLNEQRELPIQLEDEIEYFVFHAALAVEMRIRDDDSDTAANLTVKVPVGGEVLLLADYTDPMYFVYGEDDVTGAMGVGQSWRGRIPYLPIRPAKEIYEFKGKSIRVGSFDMKDIFAVEGTVIEGSHAGIDLLNDPIDASLEAGYAYGINGRMDLSVPVRDVVEFSVPIAVGSAALRAEVDTHEGGFAGAFIDGVADGFQWWPNLVPVKPIAALLVQGNVETSGAFDLHLRGEFGIAANGEPEKLVGDFHATPNALTATGAVVTGDATYQIEGQVTGTETTISVVPPPQLLDRIGTAVNADIDASIAEAQQAWEDLQEATADYEFELSLRGLRAVLPGIIDVVKSQIAANIAAQLRNHEGTLYYTSLRDFLYAEDDKYYDALNRLKALALATQDSNAWRAGIAAALRTAAAYGWFDETYRYVVLGQTLVTVNVRVRVLSDTQVAQLNLAADNVRYIAETSAIKVRAQDIYDRIPHREIFERVRDNLRDGVVMIPAITEIGFVLPHASTDLTLFATIGGTRTSIGSANLFDLAQLSAALAAKVVDMLIQGSTAATGS